MEHPIVDCRSSFAVVLATMMLAVCCGVAAAGETTVGVALGSTAGFGVQGDVTFHEFTRTAPLSLRISGAFSGRDAGSALDARRVFINDNTNGTPEASARVWQMRLDLLVPVAHVGRTPVQLGLGVRRAYFSGSFDFVGGNETFEIDSNPWGAGFFAETVHVVSDRVDFSLQLGLDYFFDARIEGHDTAYEPDGDNVNPRNDYTWDDADEAVNQPTIEPFGMIGVRFRLGR